MIDVHAPDLIDTLNRRARTDHAALVRDLEALAKDRPGDFILLLFEAMPDDDSQATSQSLPGCDSRTCVASVR